ncbi:MAG: thymidylate kinase [Herminiimonas sp.]|nr:thymidylate kinase [Herminiimonas sp.]
MSKGCMIVCDGGNGAGKSTVLQSIEHHLIAQGRDPVMTREPGGTPIGEKIREVLLDRGSSEMFDVTELMLFAAARAQHVREKILPAINSGKIVVSDRFDSATVSFQHYGRGLPLNLIRQLNDIATDGFKPDITIILDLDPAAGLKRVHSRGSELDRMEQENLQFLQKARTGYLEQAKDDPDHFIVIDASKPLEIVISEAIRIVDQVVSKSYSQRPSFT